MIYWVVAFVVLVALIGGAMWLATASGTVAINWLDYDVSVPIGFALGAVLLVILSSSFVTRFVLWLLQTPGQWRSRHQESSRRKGMTALTKAFTALAANDLEEAEKEARQLQQYLGHSPLFLLVQSQLAHQKGDVMAARHYYSEMTHHQDTRFLARRGLARDAMQSGHYRAAIDHLHDALNQRPDALWAWHNLLRLSILEEDWEQAAAILEDDKAHKAFPTRKMAPLHAIISFKRAAKTTDDDEKMSLLKQSLRKDSRLTAAACMMAQHLNEHGEDKKAKKCLENAWRAAPHPELYQCFRTIARNDDTLLRHIEQLTHSHPTHTESCLALAQTACDAGLWRQAEEYLAPIISNADERCCLLMVHIKESLGIAEEALSWREKMSQAPPRPIWQCGSCFEHHKEWQAVCHHCGTIAAIEWRSTSKRRSKPLLATKDSFDDL